MQGFLGEHRLSYLALLSDTCLRQGRGRRRCPTGNGSSFPTYCCVPNHQLSCYTGTISTHLIKKYENMDSKTVSFYEIYLIAKHCQKHPKNIFAGVKYTDHRGLDERIGAHCLAVMWTKSEWKEFCSLCLAGKERERWWRR